MRVNLPQAFFNIRIEPYECKNVLADLSIRLQKQTAHARF